MAVSLFIFKYLRQNSVYDTWAVYLHCQLPHRCCSNEPGIDPVPVPVVCARVSNQSVGYQVIIRKLNTILPSFDCHLFRILIGNVLQIQHALKFELA